MMSVKVGLAQLLCTTAFIKGALFPPLYVKLMNFAQYDILVLMDVFPRVQYCLNVSCSRFASGCTRATCTMILCSKNSLKEVVRPAGRRTV